MTDRRVDRITLERASRWIILTGLVLCILAVVSGLLNAFQDKVMGEQFFGPGASFPIGQRVSYFLQGFLSVAPWTVMVVAAGFALRAYAGRVPPAPPGAKADRRRVDLPEAEPFPDATLFLPPPPPQPERANGASNGEVVFAKPDDELWRS